MIIIYTVCILDYGHCQGRNGEFCVTVGPVPGLLGGAENAGLENNGLEFAELEI